MVAYRKPTLEVYRGEVDVALANFEKADVLLQFTWRGDPSPYLAGTFQCSFAIHFDGTSYAVVAHKRYKASIEYWQDN
jgi:hypothetical protein